MLFCFYDVVLKIITNNAMQRYNPVTMKEVKLPFKIFTAGRKTELKLQYPLILGNNGSTKPQDFKKLKLWK